MLRTRSRTVTILSRGIGSAAPSMAKSSVSTRVGDALPRVLVAILENYQTPEGTITIPDALRPYMEGLTEIS